MSAGTLDLALAGLIALGVWRGVRAGALSQLVGTVGLVVALWLAAGAMGPVGDLVVASLGLSDRLAPVLGFGVTFAAVLSALTFAAFLVRRALALLKLGAVDKLAGAGFGGLRAALVLSVLLLVTSAVALPGGAPLLVGEETREQSVLYAPVQTLAPSAWDLFCALAPGLQDTLLDKFDDDD
ncbi:MAG: CvpA family protein [Bacteroidota bacterium]